MDSPAVHTYLMAPLVKGVVAGTFAQFYLGSLGKVPLLGMPVSPAVLIGSSVAGASLVGALSHDFVLSKIKGNKYVDLEGKASRWFSPVRPRWPWGLPLWARSI